jgi:hypothetical protein
MRTIIRAAATMAAACTALGGVLLAVPSDAHSARPTWHVTIKTGKSQVSVGKKIHFKGKVAKSAAGKLVVLQEKIAPRNRWKDQRNALVHADGHYATYDVPTVNRVRKYRVVMPATKHHKRGVSPAVRVVVYKWQDLTSLPEVNADHLYEDSSIKMNGKSFPASLEAYMWDGSPTTQSVEYNLDHQCRKFRGYFGISDDSEAGGQASVTASADGTSWYSHTFALGEYAHDAVTWKTAPLKVRFDTASLNAGVNGLGAIGTPEVYCTQ